MGSACTTMHVIYVDEEGRPRIHESKRIVPAPVEPVRPPLQDEVVYTVQRYSHVRIPPRAVGSASEGAIQRMQSAVAPHMQELATYAVNHADQFLPALRGAVNQLQAVM